MATLSDVLEIQKQYNILQAPLDSSSLQEQSQQTVKGLKTAAVATTTTTVQVNLVNHTTSSNVYAYVSGLDVNKDGAPFLLQSDGKTPYYPASPTGTLQPLQADCNIKLGAPGSTTTITLPQAAGGRFWFCEESQLTFLLNPGPALVEPSVSNTGDPNYYLKWDFCEFTFNSFQLFVNITYVDFVSMPIALSLLNTSNNTYEVKGMTSTGLDSVCSQLTAQNATDGAGWDKLVITSPSGGNLRALSPVQGIVMNSNLFNGYYQPYIDKVWAKYSTSTLQLDTQGSWGVQTGSVVNGVLSFPNVTTFSQPSAADIFKCNSGPFADTAGEIGNIGARLCAAFNRSTLLINSNQPDGEQISQYYQDPVTNHYSRIVHSVNDSGKGYAFPYDDVAPSDDLNVAGTVADSNPSLLTITVGGSNVSSRSVHASEHARSGGRSRQMVGGYRVRRGLDWTSAEDEKRLLAQHDAEEVPLVRVVETDLEQGSLEAKREGELVRLSRPAMDVLQRPVQSLIPATLKAKLAELLERVEGSTAYAYAKPAVDVATKAIIMVLSLSVRTVVSRVVMVLFLVLCSFLLGFLGRGAEAQKLFVDAVDPTA